MSALGQKQTCAAHKTHVRFTPDCDRKSGHRGPDGGRSISALPCTSNVDLLRNREGIVHINAEMSDSALYLGVTKQKLDGVQISGAA